MSRLRHPRAALAAMAVVIVAAAGTTGGGSASGETVTVGTGELKVEGQIKPTVLPRKRAAPVRLRLGSEVRGFGDEPAPALTRMLFDLDRNMRVDSRGLGRCPRARINDTRTRRAERVCGRALVGHGHVDAVIEPEDQTPLEVRGPMLAFNGRPRNGLETIIFHVFARTPAPTVFVSAAKVRRARGSRYGRRLRIDVPQFGGDGRVTAARLRLNRSWRFRGQQRSYVKASCRRGRLIAKMRLKFRDADDLRGGFARSCRVEP